MAANVNVILARDVLNLGRLGDVVKVRPGYARNFLFPQSLALPVSEKRVRQFDHQKRLIEHQRQKRKAHSQDLAQKLNQTQLTISVKVGEQGKLFGSIGTRDIEKALASQNHNISHRDIKLEQPIKSVGLHSIELRLEGDVKALINLVVVPEAEATA
ncbi:MAG: 50S ribosomal protein L9 [Myxococcaceae bacterium]|nr:50S ribosomal protein L9 [Myxococcaceae bacterium]MBH2005913.1 50S ribosomal protein L9 [Myxococcaceae bacterium]